MARIVLISPYLKGGQNAAKLAQRTRYVATRPGVELLADERSTLPATKKQQEFIARLLKSFPPAGNSLSTRNIWITPPGATPPRLSSRCRRIIWRHWIKRKISSTTSPTAPASRRTASTGCGMPTVRYKISRRRYGGVAEHTGNVWTPVIALRREDAERLGYDSAKNWQALVKASANDIAAAYKIQSDNLRWYAAFHRKPKQVHIHMIVFSTDPREGYLTKEGIRQVKSAFARRIYYADRMHIYQQKRYRTAGTPRTDPQGHGGVHRAAGAWLDRQSKDGATHRGVGRTSADGQGPKGLRLPAATDKKQSWMPSWRRSPRTKR